MAYCFIEITDGEELPSIEQAIGTIEAARLSGDENGAVINADWWEDKIVKADSKIDDYCGNNYAVPFASGSVPKGISETSRDLAIYYAYQDRAQEIPAWLRYRYDDAMVYLKDIAANKVKLNVAEADATPGLSPAIPFKSRQRLFERPYAWSAE